MSVPRGSTRSRPRAATWLTAAGAVGRRPDLWPTAARVTRSMVPRQWWRRRPFLPVPDPGWVRFRTITAYGGDGTAPMAPGDVVTWLEWCRRFPTGH